jgi:hypothetical protein
MHSPTSAALVVMSAMNWDVANVHASLWSLSGGKLIKLDSRTLPFIQSGGSTTIRGLTTPFRGIGRLISCVQYNLQNRIVEILDFYTNEGHTPAELAVGIMTKYRPSVIEVDRGGRLCSSMPSSATRYI